MTDLNNQAKFLTVSISICFALLILTACVWLYPASSPTTGRPMSPWRRNVRNIGFALHQYYSGYDSFPPAYAIDSDGRRMHSWRVLIAPYLRDVWQSEADWLERRAAEAGFWESRDFSKRALLAQQKADELRHFLVAYDFSEAWDSETNRKLVSHPARAFQCSAEGQNDDLSLTQLAAVVGPETAWPYDASSQFGAFMDGISNTALVVEITNSNIPWMSPRDVEFSEFEFEDGETPTNHVGNPLRDGGAYVLFADGSVRFLDKTPTDALRALFTINGHEPRIVIE